MITTNDSILAEIIEEPLIQWFSSSVNMMYIAAVIAGILILLGLPKLARFVLGYIGVKIK